MIFKSSEPNLSSGGQRSVDWERPRELSRIVEMFCILIVSCELKICVLLQTVGTLQLKILMKTASAMFCFN
jgi:hypothetical protein